MTDRPIIFSAREADRFDALVSPEPNSGCWLWLGSVNIKGYGRFGRGELAHRTSLRLVGIVIPHGFEVDHKCRVRCCVNPDHLDVVTHRENLMRGDTITRKAAETTHCPKGHPYEGWNLVLRSGKRRCRECDRQQQEGVYQPIGDRRRRRHLTPLEVAKVREMIANGIPHSKIAPELGISIAAVSFIRTGKSHGR